MHQSKKISPSWIVAKLVVLLFLLAIDLIACSFVELTFNTTLELSEEDYDAALEDSIETSSYYIKFVLLPFQLSIHFMVMVWFFLLLWSTFLFQYGKIGALARDFNWGIAFSVGSFFILILERVVRLASDLTFTRVNSDDGSINYFQTELNKTWYYMILYYLNFLGKPFCAWKHSGTVLAFYYPVLIFSGIQVSQPKYFNPKRYYKGLDRTA